MSLQSIIPLMSRCEPNWKKTIYEWHLERILVMLLMISSHGS
jgi:hypothetical protein